MLACHTKLYRAYSKNKRDLNHRVREKAFSDKVHLVFNAGLEGAGHQTITPLQYVSIYAKILPGHSPWTRQ